MAKGKRLKNQWLEELRNDSERGQSVRSRLVAMEVNTRERFDSFAGTPPPLKYHQASRDPCREPHRLPGQARAGLVSL